MNSSVFRFHVRPDQVVFLFSGIHLLYFFVLLFLMRSLRNENKYFYTIYKINKNQQKRSTMSNNNSISENFAGTKPVIAREMYVSLEEKITLKDGKNWQPELENVRNDPNSPLYSETTFENLNLKPGILEMLKFALFKKPTKFQETVIPALIAEPPRDMIAQGQSSTGKTTAMIIAVLNRIDASKKHAQVLYFSPTYESADYVIDFVVRIEIIPGMEWAFANNSRTPGEAQIIIGTPEYIYRMWKQGGFDAKQINVFAVDDADYIINRPDCWDKCCEIQKQVSPTCQKILVSTTFDRSSMEIAKSFVKNPIMETMSPQELPLNNITQIYVRCGSQGDKFQAICDIYELLRSMNKSGRPVQAMIFCNTNETAHQLYENIRQSDIFIDVNSKGQQICRVGIITNEVCKLIATEFLGIYQGHKRCSKLNAVLGLDNMVIATDIISRGIRSARIGIVVNYDLPVNQSGEADYNTYLNRIGRTGRFGKNGIAINLIDSEDSMKLCEAIGKHFHKEIKPIDSINTNHMPRASYEDTNEPPKIK